MKISHFKEVLSEESLQELKDWGLFSIIEYIKEYGYEAFDEYRLKISKFLFWSMKPGTEVFIDNIVKARNKNLFIDVVKLHICAISENDLPVLFSNDYTKIIRL